MKLRCTLIAIIVLLVGVLTAAPVLAHPDSDGDGLTDDVDNCPGRSGPASNGGCPLSGGGNNNNQPDPNDPDGDQIFGGMDACPNNGGPFSNNGCPPGMGPTAQQTQQQNTGVVSPGQVTSPQPVFVPPPILADGPCVIATRTAQTVNIRRGPSTQTTVLGAMQPTNFYRVLLELHGVSEDWALTERGWVALWVSRQGGNCSERPIIQLSSDGKDLSEVPQAATIIFNAPVYLQFAQHPAGTLANEVVSPNTYALSLQLLPGALPLPQSSQTARLALEPEDGQAPTNMYMNVNGEGQFVFSVTAADATENNPNAPMLNVTADGQIIFSLPDNLDTGMGTGLGVYVDVGANRPPVFSVPADALQADTVQVGAFVCTCSTVHQDLMNFVVVYDATTSTMQLLTS